MKLSLIAAVSENNVIGHDLDIPWKAYGEQYLFKAFTYNQWLLVGRKTFEAMGALPHRKFAVISRTSQPAHREGLLFFPSLEAALEDLAQRTDHVIVAGGGQVYQHLLEKCDALHVSTVHIQVDGNVFFPAIPPDFHCVFSQHFQSNIDYTYAIWVRRTTDFANIRPFV